MMFNKKGFTLVELLMVVIIIGILVTLAVPNYYRSVERAKGGKAKAAMDAIRKAELQYRAFNDTFVGESGSMSDLQNYDLPNDLVAAGDDADWTYGVTNTSASTMTVTATRKAGPYSSSSFTMDQDGTITGTGDAAVDEVWGIH